METGLAHGSHQLLKLSPITSQEVELMETCTEPWQVPETHHMFPITSQEVELMETKLFGEIVLSVFA